MLSELIQRSATFQAERRKAEAEANRKRAAAASQQENRGNQYTAAKKVEVGPQLEALPPKIANTQPIVPTKRDPIEKNARKASTALERADFIRKNSPALAQKVIDGEVPASAAIREIRREQKKEELKGIAAQEAVAPTGLFDVIVIDPPWPSRLARIRRLLCADVRL
ncbi:MAG: hypothetical protein ABTR27_16275 [Candidatus Competibacter phosphatis]